MNDNIKIARQLIRIAKSIVGVDWSISERYNPHGGDDYSLFDDYSGTSENSPYFKKFKSDIEKAGWTIVNTRENGIDSDDDMQTVSMDVTVERVSGSLTLDQLFDSLCNNDYGDEDGFYLDDKYLEDYNDKTESKGYIIIRCDRYYPQP